MMSNNAQGQLEIKPEDFVAVIQGQANAIWNLELQLKAIVRQFHALQQSNKTAEIAEEELLNANIQK